MMLQLVLPAAKRLLGAELAPSNITRPLFAVRTIRGFCQGLFTNTWALIVYNALIHSSSASEIPIFGWHHTAIEWTTLSYVVGVLAGALLEIPTSLFADMYGRRYAIVGGLVSLGLALMSFAAIIFLGEHRVSPLVIFFAAVVAEIFFALYFATLSGAFTAWLHDELDNLGRTALLPRLVAGSQCAYFASFILGSFLGIACYLRGWLFPAYVITAVTTLAVAGLQARHFGEFRNLAAPQPHPRRSIFVHAFSIVNAGRKRVMNQKFLLVIFASQASVLALTWAVNSFWTVLANQRFGSVLTKGMTFDWFLITMVFCATPLLGSIVYAGWMHAQKLEAQTLGLGRLINVYGILNLIYVSPILVGAVILNSTHYSDRWQFYIFLGLMTWHKLMPGALLPIIESLRNALLHGSVEERATVISFGAFIENLVVAGLMFGTVGAANGQNFALWALPSVAVIGSTLLLIGWSMADSSIGAWDPVDSSQGNVEDATKTDLAVESQEVFG